MSTKKIENLVLWLTIALVIQFILGGLLKSYIQISLQDIENMTPIFGLTSGRMILYSNYVGVLLTLIVNLVISLWLFKYSENSKILWASFGLFAKWWALPIFFIYWYMKNNTKT